MDSITRPSQGEFNMAREFFENHLKNGCAFSFVSQGERLCADDQSGGCIEQKPDRTVCRRIFTKACFEITLEAVLYNDVPVTEWTVYVKNTSDAVSPAAEFNALDYSFPASDITLYRNMGSDCRPEDFAPVVQPVFTGNKYTITPFEGRSSNHEWPYFALALGSMGINIAIGWLGQWSACFEGCIGSLHATCGQEKMNSVMLPGEEFRSPRIVLQFWDYNGLSREKAVRRAKNIFRRYMRAHNMPRLKDGTVPTHELSACSSHQFLEMTKATTKDQMDFIDGYCRYGIKLDNWWMDAGWYPCGGEWQNLGKWDYDQERFPGGLREIADHAAEKGMGIILWHEPERARMGYEMHREHPEFLLKGDGGRMLEYGRDTRDMLFNFGDENARRWMTDKINGNISRYGVTVYRQDFNTDLLPFLENNEDPKRRGALENHYVCGMLAYWDALQSEHPGMLIDECASGGRRNDIDAMKRAVPFIRSDFLFEPSSQQCHMSWLSDWLPFSGTGMILGNSVIDGKAEAAEFDRYALESCFAAHITCCFDVRDENLDWKGIRDTLEQWHDIVECYSGDYYPLISAALEPDIWTAWQFNRFDEGDGVVQAFRREENGERMRILCLNDLDPEANYSFTRLDNGQSFTVSGHIAMERGIAVELAKRESAVIKYNRL